MRGQDEKVAAEFTDHSFKLVPTASLNSSVRDWPSRARTVAAGGNGSRQAFRRARARHMNHDNRLAAVRSWPLTIKMIWAAGGLLGTMRAKSASFNRAQVVAGNHGKGRSGRNGIHITTSGSAMRNYCAS